MEVTYLTEYCIGVARVAQTPISGPPSSTLKCKSFQIMMHSNHSDGVGQVNERIQTY